MVHGKPTVMGPLAVGAIIYLIVCFGIGSRNVEATHFRGGTISWKPSDSFSLTYKEIIFTFKLGWRHSRIECDEKTITSGALVGEDAEWVCMYGCKGVVASTREKCTEYNIGDDWMYGSNTFKYVFDSDGPIEISYMECCWLIDLLVGAGGEWALTTMLNLGIRSDTGRPNSSPVAAMTPMIKLRVGVPDVIDLAVRDTDGDRIACRLGRHIGECGTICTLFSEFTLDEENCLVRYEPIVNKTGNVPVAIMVEDHHRSNEGITMGKKTFKITEALSTVPMQFIVILEMPPANCTEKPLIEASISASQPVKVRQGKNFTFTVTSTPCDVTSSIEEFILIAPIGVRKSPTIVSNGKYTTRITWTPTAEQDGSNLICVRARSSDGVLSEQICITAEVPKAAAFCAVMGGSHFITFDKWRYDFFGMCKYKLAGTIPTAGPELTPFSITLSNEETPAAHSAVRIGVVEAQTMGQKVTIDNKRDVYLNGVPVNLPIRMKSGLRVEKSSHGVSVSLPLSIRIYIDDATLSLELPQNYAGQVEGLCGNYNGKAEDDLTSRGRDVIASDEVEFATSFRVGDNNGEHSCGDAMPGLQNLDDCARGTKRKATRQCNILTKKNGGCFSQCHGIVDPTHFHENCVRVLCQSSDDFTALDVLIRAYADACQREGITVCDWRSKLRIALECPPNTHYEKCAPAVPATCADSMATKSFATSTNCIEGCPCNKGYILSGSICVPESECGCMIGDVYYPKGFTYRAEGCKRECVCGDGCRDVNPCVADSTCVKADDGFHRCEFKVRSSATCKAVTDPHYETFDGTVFDAMGTCAYIMARSKSNITKSAAFTVIAVNNQSAESANASHVKEVHVKFGGGHTMALLKDHVVKIDGIEISPGSTIYGVEVRRVGRWVIADFNFGLVIRWDGIDMLRITVWTPLRYMVEGMCGDWDGNADNDFAIRPRADVAVDPGSFPASWRVEGYGTEDCYEMPGTPTLQPPCADDILLAQYRQECRGLVDPKGAFAACHALVNPTNAFNNCVYDLCALDGDRDVKERIFSSYAEDCLEENTVPSLWRDVENLVEECVDGVYSECMDQCQPTCSDPTASECSSKTPNRLGDRCVEGCSCEEGRLLSGSKCVPLRECGCTIDGRYEEKGFAYATSDCSQRCVCEGPENVVCRPGRCDKGEDSCRQREDGYFECIRRPRRRATCRALTDPHYMTFDRKRYDSMGVCSYIMVRSKEGTDVTPFRVVTVNEQPQPNMTVSHVKEVWIHVEDSLTVSMKDGGVISVNGKVAQPGTNVGGVEIQKAGRFWVANFRDIGFYVKWDGEDRLRVSAWSVLREKVEGLCGDFNDDKSNDFTTPGGELVQNTTVFVESWKTTEHEPDSCRPEFDVPDDLCSLDDMERHEITCGSILDPDGIYSPCIDTVDPEPFKQNCVFDLCAYRGSVKFKETIYAEYVAECLLHNITITTNWRVLDNLQSPNCTANSHMESPIDQCQPTCSDRDGSVCKGGGSLGFERVEGCVCDDGYILSGDECVLESECGCVDEDGNYFQKGFVYRTQDCSTECECVADGKLLCSAVGECPKGDRCRKDADGYKRCIKHIRRRATCKAVTDPHYTTFDGVKYDSMGTCAYIMARSKAGTLETPFRVVAVNERPKAGNIVSHVKEIFVHVGDDITLTFKAGPVIEINDEVVEPGTTEQGIQIRRVGRFTVAEFPFGLVVKWDGIDRLRVMAWGRLKGIVEGLCGDFNDDPTNDFTMSNGELETNVTKFVNSWKVSGYDTEDCLDPPDVVVVCDTPEKLRQAQENCEVLIDTSGPFFPCFEWIQPQGAYNNCLVDMCAYDGDRAIRERIIASYSEDCKEVEVSNEAPPEIGEIREPEEEESLCEENSHFENCGAPCQPTCGDEDASICLAKSSSITGSCVEGCVCDEGFIRSGTVCIRKEDCGCQIEGRYVQKGFVHNNRNCSVQCTCVGKEEVSCVSTGGCEKGFRCRINDEGRRACLTHIRRRATCKAVTDPHYMSFDGRKFDSMGTCAYIMTQSKDDADVEESFKVIALNVKPAPDQIVSHVREVHVMVGSDVTVSFLPGPVVKINGEEVLPGSQIGSVQIRKVGKFTVAEFDFGLVVKWDGEDRLRIMAWGSLKSQVEGICGDFNDDPEDDFRIPSGRIENNIDKFVKSWRARDWSPPGCLELQTPPPGPLAGTICLSNSTIYNEFYHNCSILDAADGPYRRCHEFIDPVRAFNDCLHDMCHTNGDRDTFNRNVLEYSEDCLEATNTTIQFASVITCESNSTAAMGMEQCQPTCHDRDASICKANSSLGDQLVSGCKCDDGLLLGGNACVTPEDCGCLIDEKYYDKGYKYLDSECEEECECAGVGDVTCRSVSPCPTTERCTKVNGHYECIPRIRKMATCKAITDPHYTTFDGKAFNTPGRCSYTMVQALRRSDAPQFRVSVSHEEESADEASSRVSEVVVRYGDNFKMSIARGERVKINGVRYYAGSSVQGVIIRQVGLFTLVEFPFGLVIRWDSKDRLRVTVWEQLKGKVEGLCGRYNDDAGDDFTMKNGELTDDVAEFVESWRDKRHPTPKCIRPRLYDDASDCDDLAVLARYESECDVLLDTEGPFAVCHRVADQNVAYDACVADLCRMDGDLAYKDGVITSYTHDCLEFSRQPGPWRLDENLVIACPDNSKYVRCKSQCQPTCSDPDASLCKKKVPYLLGAHCVEGCRCNFGFMLSHDKCVRQEDCGCMEDGVYYVKGFKFKREGCTEECECRGRNDLQCREIPAGCLVNRKCKKAASGLHQCLPGRRRRATCRAITDPHYTTFDGTKFDSQGVCSYVMVRSKFNVTVDEFSVVAVNEQPKPDQRVSHVKEVHVTYRGHRLVLYAGPVAEIDGEVVNVGTRESGMKLEMSGRFLTAFFDFGLIIEFDGEDRLRVAVLGALRGQIEGVCGDFDDDPSNDLTLATTGEIVTDTEEFVNSWRVLGFNDGCATPLADFLAEEPAFACPSDRMEAAHVACSVLTDSGGVLKDCQRYADAPISFDNCVLDMCANVGDRSIHDRVISDFSDACREEGGELDKDWRKKANLTEVQCPLHSHFEPCMDHCQPTCWDVDGSECHDNSDVDEHCVEGCAPDEGYLLSADEYVPATECGCYKDGRYYKSGESFYTKECETFCNCKSGIVNCRLSTCARDEKCAINATGKLGCVEIEQSTCHVWGSTHFATFDGRTFDTAATCNFVLTRRDVERGDPSSRQLTFIVSAITTKTEDSKLVEARAIRLRLPGQGVTIVLRQDAQARIGGKLFYNWQSEDESRLIRADRRGSFIVIKTFFGLEVAYDGNNVRITLPKSLAKKTEGLCGNMNGDPKDDFYLKNGLPNQDLEKFLLSFAGSGCSGTDDLPPYSCSRKDRSQWSSAAKCGAIVDSDSEFANCSGKLDGRLHFNKCVKDVCRAGGSKNKVLKQALKTFAHECAAIDEPVCNWRRDLMLQIACPVNSHYVGCTSACEDTCGAAKDKECRYQQVEDCVCDEGYIRSYGQCVAKAACGGCLIKRKMRLKGFSYRSERCSKICTCVGNEEIECEDAPACISRAKCVREEGGLEQCLIVPRRKAKCQAFGSGHFVSFDGARINTTTTCLLTMARTKAGATIPEFSVTVDMRPARRFDFSRVGEVIIRTETLDMIMAQGRTVMVNGRNVALGSVLETVAIRKVGRNVVAVFNFGLIVRWDGRQNVRLDARRVLAGQMEGLCGDFDEDESDDYLTPFGVVETDTSVFINSWRDEEPNSGCRLEGPFSSPCDDSLESLIEYKDYCEMMYSDDVASYAACNLFEYCLFEMCATSGDRDYIAATIYDFYVSCNEEHGNASQKLEIEAPVLECSENSHFNSCMSQCQATCSDKEATVCLSEESLREGCVSGCECDRGFVLNGEDCVRPKDCGCVGSEGEYYPNKYDSYVEECERKCQCNDGVLTCQETRCYPGQYCGYRGDVYGCQWEDKCKYNNGGCDHVCVWSEGIASCSCKAGYNLTADGKTCHSVERDCGAATENLTEWKSNTMQSWVDKMESFVKAMKKGTETGEPAQVCRTTWTDWFDVGDPDATGDDESLQALRAKYPAAVCRNPVAIEAQLTDGRNAHSTGLVVRTMSPAEGLQCFNADQRKKETCGDFRVRYLCLDELV